ncbi:unnamed protein product [Lathyrus oleraceus]
MRLSSPIYSSSSVYYSSSRVISGSAEKGRESFHWEGKTFFWHQCLTLTLVPVTQPSFIFISLSLSLPRVHSSVSSLLFLSLYHK